MVRSTKRVGRERFVIFGIIVGVSVAMPTASASAQEPATSVSRVERLLQIGQGHARAGNHGSAVGYFREAIQVSPNDARGYAALAEAYLRIDQISNALEVTTSGLRRRPGDRPLSWVHARVLVSATDPRADAALSRITRRYPDFLPARRLVAERARASGNWSLALASFRALVRYETDDEKRAEARELVAALFHLASLDPLVRHCAGEPTPFEQALCDARL